MARPVRHLGWKTTVGYGRRPHRRERVLGLFELPEKNAARVSSSVGNDIRAGVRW